MLYGVGLVNENGSQENLVVQAGSEDEARAFAKDLFQESAVGSVWELEVLIAEQYQGAAFLGAI